MLTENKLICSLKILNCEFLDNNNPSICKKCSGLYKLYYEYNFTAILEDISNSSYSVNFIKLLYFALNNKYSFDLLTN